MNAAAAAALLSVGASTAAEDSGGCNALHLLTARPRDVAPGVALPVDGRCAAACVRAPLLLEDHAALRLQREVCSGHEWSPIKRTDVPLPRPYNRMCA